jgi:hypothetical protein
MRPWLRDWRAGRQWPVLPRLARDRPAAGQGADAAGLIAQALDGAEDEDHLRSQALAALEKVLAIAETLNIAAIRAQFPGLGGNWHYLDTGATAQKPQAVIDACTRAMGQIMPPCTAASMPAAPT